MDLFKNNGNTLLSMNQDFEKSYQKTIDKIWDSLPLIKDYDNISIRGKTIIINNENYDLLITNANGFKSVYLNNEQYWNKGDLPRPE